MPNRHLERTAASLLGSWTDSDTAMQIVGTSLGLFGPELLDPTAVLAHETPLRNALFDVLLSLVEGGALDLRPTDDAGYAFRFRTDFATAALNPDTSRSVDIDTPSPYLAELVQVRRERDEALGRADFAEALAAERERMLRLGDSPRKRPIRRTKVSTPANAPEDAPDIDLTAIEADEAAERAAEMPEPVAVAAPAGAATVAAPPEPAVVEPTPEPVVVADEPEPEPEPVIEPEPEVVVEAPKATKPGVIAGLPPEPEILAAPRVAEASGLPPEPVIETLHPTDAEPVAGPEAEALAATPKKAPVKKTAAKKSPPKKAAPKKRVAKKPAAKAATTDEPDAAQVASDEPGPSEVVYLTPPVADDAVGNDDDALDDHEARRAKWSGYTLDKPRAHLASVERLAEDG